MQEDDPTLEDVLKLVEQLSPDDKRRLMERIAPEFDHILTREQRRARRSLLGIAADLGPGPSEEEIYEARKEAWARFPREDI
jgi:hypothetical protein